VLCDDCQKRERHQSKMDPAPNSNSEKEPDDWDSGDDPMTGAQASYLKALSEECDEPESFQAAMWSCTAFVLPNNPGNGLEPSVVR
jgi:hypothetical protein